MKVVPLRLQPGVDLRWALEDWMERQAEQAGCVISAVGSLSVAQLRLAGAAEAKAWRPCRRRPAPGRPARCRARAPRRWCATSARRCSATC